MGDFVEYIYIYISDNKELPENTGTPLTTYWATPESDTAKTIGMNGKTGIALLGKRSTGEIEIIGRKYGPVTQQKILDLYRLIGTGNGTNGSEGFINTTNGENFVPGTPIGLGIGNSLSTWILVALALLIIINNK